MVCFVNENTTQENGAVETPHEYKVGDRIRYTGVEKTEDGGHWIWEGTVTKRTWKYLTVRWTHSNEPVTGGPVVEDGAHMVDRRLYHQGGTLARRVYSYIAPVETPEVEA
jgi:hypothetical protein